MTGATATMLDAALDYARRRWPVFPLHSIIDGRCSCGKDCGNNAGKHPHITDWPNQATTDPTTIRQWWTRWPGANIGVATGKASGLVVLDVDPRHGGDDTLRELETQHGALSPTVEALTGGDGRHILFRYPGYSVKSGASVLGPGLDVKADGGYIVAAPSLHASGRRYAWEVSSHPDEVPIAEAPAWLLDKLRSVATNGHGHEQRTQADWLALLQGAPDGTRYDVAQKIAGHFLGIGRPVEEVEALLFGFLSQCNPPGDAEEQEKARRMVRDFAAKDAAKPEAPDPLSPLRALPDAPSPEAVEAALRPLTATVTGADPLRRERQRAEAVTILKSKKVARATRFVDAAFGMAKATPEAAENAILLVDPEPWPDPVDGAVLLTEIERAISRFVVVPREAAAAAALWIVFSHAHEVFDISPILAITSATMRCGKSLLMQIVSAFVPKALTTSNITPAALFRGIEAYSPTLVIDEGDAFLLFSEELRGILNSGHTRRGAVVIRTVGEDFEPRTFTTWCPKVLALIGKLPGTLADRSIEVRMQRKTKAEPVERFRSARLADLAPLCQQAARWVADHGEVLKAADPDVPDKLNDRAADNWRPLLAIADLAGGEWTDRARKAALTLVGEATEENSHGITLIGDIMAIFNARQVDELATTDLIAVLVNLEERPWGEWNRGKWITPRGVAGLLKPFRIVSKVIRFAGGTQHGYERKALEDVHTRYFDPSNPKHPKQSYEYNNLHPLSNPKQDPDVSERKSDLTTRQYSIVSDVSGRHPGTGRNEDVEQEFDAIDPAFETSCAADLGDLFDSEEVIV